MAYVNLVATIDFDVPPFQIPNLEEETFDDFVAQEQEEILRRVLGNALFEAYVTGIGVETPEQRWIDLRDGANYTCLGHTYKWYGLKKILVPWIYQRWLIVNADAVFAGGVAIPVLENSQYISPASRISRAYNRFVDYVGKPFNGDANTLFEFLANSDQVYVDSIDSWSSIEQYLSHIEEDFGTMNEFGI